MSIFYTKHPKAKLIMIPSLMQRACHFFSDFDSHQSFVSFLLLFASLNTLGNVPVFMSIRRKLGPINALHVSAASGLIMIAFLLGGKLLLELFCIDDASFAITGGIVLFLIGLELLLGISFLQIKEQDSHASSVVPLAFPIIAGSGTMATLLTLRTKYAMINILCAIFGNLLLVYWALGYTDWFEKKLGHEIVSVSKKITGLILLATAIKLMRTNILLPV